MVVLLLPVACALDPVAPDGVGPSNGWSIVHPLPGGYDLEAVWGERPEDVWAVGISGVVVHWTGETYTRVDSPVTSDLAAIDGWSADEIYACSEDDLIAWNGQAWSREAFPGADTMNDLLCAPDGRLYVAADDGVHIRGNGAWTRLEGPEAECALVWAGPDGRVRVAADDELWVIDGDVMSLEQTFPGYWVRFGDGACIGLMKTRWDPTYVVMRYVQDDGWTEEAAASSSMYALLDDGVKAAYTCSAGIYEDAEQIWTCRAGYWVYGLARCGDGLFACGYGGLLMYGEPGDEGFDWNESMEGIGFRSAVELHGSACDDVWAAQWWGRALHFDGETWSREPTPLPSDQAVSWIRTFGESGVAAIGGGRLALRSPEGEWTLLPETDGEIAAVQVFAPDSLLAAQAGGLRFWDGSAWSDVGEFTGTVRDMAARPGGGAYILCADTTHHLTAWDGTGVETLLEMPGFNACTLAVDPVTETIWIGGYKFAGGERGTLYRYDGETLVDESEDFSPGTYFRDMHLMGTDDVFVLLERELWRYRDGIWAHEQGLPLTDSYRVLWGVEGCGLWVEGVPTYFKEF